MVGFGGLGFTGTPNNRPLLGSIYLSIQLSIYRYGNMPEVLCRMSPKQYPLWGLGFSLGFRVYGVGFRV